jgi:hypothetical protein
VTLFARDTENLWLSALNEMVTVAVICIAGGGVDAWTTPAQSGGGGE